MASRHSVSGITLLEVLIAILVFALALIPVVKVLVQGIRGTHASIDELFATNYAVALLEDLKNLPYGSIGETSEISDSELANVISAPNLQISSVPPPFERTVRIVELSKKTEDPDAAANSKWGSVKEVQVRVKWQSMTSSTIKPELVLSRLVADEDRLVE
jgi:hypothetical protein